MTDFAVPIGTWIIDPIHSSIEFSARHLMVGRVRGRFNVYSGSVTVSENGNKAQVEANVDIEANSVDTGNEKRDDDLRSPNFLDVENHPMLRFTLSEVVNIDAVERDDEGGYAFDLPGALIVRDVSRPVVLNVTYEGTISDHKGKERVAFVATSKINRRDWDLTWNMALEKGGVLVGDAVKLALEIEAVRAE